MASKYQIISALAEETSKEISRTGYDWMGYLDTASRLYKYPFKDQLLIHAQKPDATACASLELWNNRMGRWVNRGAKGIALIDDSVDWPRLKYVFDISDTHRGRDARDPYLWELKTEDHDALVSHLQSRYESVEARNLEDALREAAKEQVRDHLDEYLEKLSYAVDGSFLEGLDELNLEMRFRETMEDSLFYTLLSRCGLDIREYFDENSFPYIMEFSSTTALSQLGTAVTENAEPMLSDIGRMLRVREQQKYKEDSRESIEKNPNPVYNEFSTLTRESETMKGENKNEKSDRNGIYEQRGVPDSESEDGRSTEEATGEVRKDEEELSEGVSERTVSGATSERETDTAPVGDRSDGVREDGANGEADGGPRGSEREVESRESNAVGSENGEYPKQSRGSDLDRAGLQLNEIPDSEILSGISLEGNVPLKAVDEVLRMGGNQRQGVLRIAAHFMLSAAEDAAFMQNEYRWGGMGLKVDGKQYSVWFDENGMKIAPGEDVRFKDDALSLTWEQVAGRTKELLSTGAFAPQVVLDQAIPNERSELAASLWYLRQDTNGDFFMDEGLFKGGFPDSTQRIAGLLEDEQFLAETLQGLGSFVMEYEENKSLLRFPFHNPEEILKRLSGLSMEPVLFPQSQIDGMRQNVDFITQDEVNQCLRRGGSYSGSRLAVYSYFIQNHTDKEKADYLKESYGTGGHSHAISRADNSHADYDAKGILLTRGSYLNEPENATVYLSWAKAAKLTEELILTGRYLEAQDADQFADYEKTILSQRIASFYYNRSKAALELPDDVTSFDVTKAIRAKLDDHDWVARVVKEMSSVLAGAEETDRYYEAMQNTLADVVAFRDGNYSLFTPCKEMEAKAKERGVILNAVSEPPENNMVAVYDYPVDATVYLPDGAYTVESNNADLITLRNQMYPIFTFLYDKDELDRRVREDLRNEHLIVDWVVKENTEQNVTRTEPEAENISVSPAELEPEIQSEQEDVSEPEMEEGWVSAEGEEIPFDDQPPMLDAANEAEYEKLRQQYKVNVLIGFEHDGYFEFYGDDAHTVSEILGSQIRTKQLESGDSMDVTGFRTETWVVNGKKSGQRGRVLS